MPNMEKVIKGLERCLICDISVVAPEEAQNAYRECEYTVGLYCGEKKLLREALVLLKEQPEIVRCKDCKHATMTSDGKMCKYCEMDTDDFGDQRYVYHDADWFCANGERRTDDA